MNMMKKTGLVVAAFFIALSLFSSAAVAESENTGGMEAASTEIKKDASEKKAVEKKKSNRKKRSPVIGYSLEKRKSVLRASFLRAGISPEEVDQIFSDERLEIYHNIYEQPVLKDGAKKKKLSYFDEEFGLLNPESIEAGKKIIADNKEIFDRIESVYQVPANYIVAIVRVETNFKNNLGKYSVFNALYTMSLLGKRARRVAMANRELVAWVKICRRNGMDPFAMKGSWAGAFGIPQFMPSSYVIFAVDHDGDGNIDLHDYPDAFSSIANYLRRTGWQTGNEKKMRRAVYRYNHEKAYVNAVFAYAEKI